MSQTAGQKTLTAMPMVTRMPSTGTLVAVTHASPDRIREALNRLLGVPHAPCVMLPGHAVQAPFGMAADVTLAPPAEMLRLAMRAHETGALVVVSATGERALFLDQGGFSGSSSTFSSDRLGEVLWRKGRITLDQLTRASGAIRPGFRLGRCLVEQGHLAPSELYEALRHQALAVMEEACLQPSGAAVFVRGMAMKNPLHLREEAVTVLERAEENLTECQRLEALLLAVPHQATPTVPAPSVKLSDVEAAMLNVATTARPPLTRRELLGRVGLGRLEALRALERLVELDCLEGAVKPRKDAKAQPADVLHRLAQAVNHVLEALDDGGFGAMDAVLEFLQSPPPSFQEAIAVLKVRDRRLDTGWVTAGAGMLDEGEDLMENALRELLDFALFEARDTLPDSAMEKILQRLAPLHVLRGPVGGA
jgi:hypothetical protein